MVKSYRYVKWIKANLFTVGKLPQVKAPVEIIITAVTGKGWRSNRDIDNLAKPLIDLLKHSKIIEDDNSRIVKRIVIQTQAALPNRTACVCVKISHLSQAEDHGGQHECATNSSD